MKTRKKQPHLPCRPGRGRILSRNSMKLKQNFERFCQNNWPRSRGLRACPRRFPLRVPMPFRRDRGQVTRLPILVKSLSKVKEVWYGRRFCGVQASLARRAGAGSTGCFDSDALGACRSKIRGASRYVRPHWFEHLPLGDASGVDCGSWMRASGASA